MKNKLFTIIAAALVAFTVGTAQAAEKPNIIVILADDLGYGDLSCYNPNSAVQTPNIDRLAAEGVRFTDFYAQNCCTPTRAAFMTGCYAKRVGLHHGSWRGTVSYGDPKGLNPEETTIAELFKERGYATGMIGKWHLGDQPVFWPRRHGFDEFFGLLHSGYGADNRNRHLPPPERQPRGGKHTDILIRDDEMIAAPFEEISKLPAMFAEESIQFFARHQDRPFFLYMPHTAMHGPPNPSLAWRGKSGKDAYADLLMEFDDSVGRTLAALEKEGLADNTLVFFFSDNGGGGGTTASNFPLRHHKGSMWEGGCRVPAIVRWPGRIPAGTVCRGIANVTDLLPTLVSIVDGKPYKSDRPIDGLDVSRIFFDPEHAQSPRTVNAYWIKDEIKAIREGKWKYVDFRGGRLFDLEADNGEKKENNLLDQYPEIAQRLKKQIADAYADLGGQGEYGPGCRKSGRVENPKFILPTVDGLTEPDWNDRRWANPDDIEASLNAVREDTKARDRESATSNKPAKKEKSKTVAEPSAGSPSALSAEKPNVVLFLVDDQSWVGTSVQMKPDDPETKSDFFETPALEEMAAAGMRFTDAYSTAPLCCPSRTALEFGQTTARTRVTFNGRNNSTGPGRSIAQTLAPAGYVCGRYGKTGVDHISADELGYAEHRVWKGNTAGDYDDVPVNDHISANKVTLPPDNPKRTPEITRCGLEFLERRAKDDQPFFLYLSYFAVHVGSQATPETIAKYQAKKPGVKHTDIVYAAMTEELDDALAAVRAKLRELGLDRNTVLIYTSDNGGQFMGANKTTSGEEWDTLNLPLSGWKATVNEGGIRVPFLVEGPGIAPNSVSTVPVAGSDILPTLADLAGVDPAEDVDGGSLLPVLRNGGQGEVKRPNAPGLVWHQPWRNIGVNYPTSSALRIGEWKYLRKWTEPTGHLYNVTSDNREQHDLAEQHPERAAAMQTALDEYLNKVNAEPALPERWGHRHLEKQGKPLPPIPADDQ